MKTLDEFELVKDFLKAQGGDPDLVALVAIDNKQWIDVTILAREWRTGKDEEIAKAAEIEANLSEDELALRDKQAREEALLENDRVLFHSSGHRPEKKHV